MNTLIKDMQESPVSIKLRKEEQESALKANPGWTPETIRALVDQEKACWTRASTQTKVFTSWNWNGSLPAPGCCSDMRVTSARPATS